MTELDRKSATVGRAAYFAGIFFGVVILIAGLYGVSRLDAGGWAILLEMAVVALAMLGTTAIWRRSARAELDSSSEPRDRRE